MPTRILFWNVQTFGINKINDTSRKRTNGHGGMSLAQASEMRATILQRVLATANPDIIVLVEVASGDSSPSDLATRTGGMQGAIYLLNAIRQGNPGVGWRMVPPLRVGQANGSKPETVAVLYRGSSPGNITRYFTGPNRWSGGYDGESVIPGNTAREYPGTGNDPNLNVLLVPPNTNPRQIPNGSRFNAQQFENRLAARTRFADNDNGLPGDPLDFGVYRPPYMTTFLEVDNNNNQRNVTVFGVHSPAVAGDPGVFVAYLQSMYDVTGPRGNNEVRVIGGDFNLQLLDANGANTNVYDGLTNNPNQYTLLLSSPGAPPVNDLEAFKGYFTTHIKDARTTADSRFLWSNNANDSPYPGYGYYGSDFARIPFYSIDNILVWGGGGNYQTTIMNYITGAPFNKVLNPPGNAPVGSVQMGDSFLNTYPVNGWPPAPAAPQVYQGIRNNLAGWMNYGYGRDTSDHFAMFAVV